MKLSNRTRAGIAVVACAAVGAAGGIAGSAAAPGKKSSSRSTTSTTPMRARPMHRPGGPAVHVEAVVLNKARTAFITVTMDNGKVKSVSGRDVTIAEAIGGVTYKDVTITLPDDAKIVRNGKAATVGDLKADDRIHVAQSSDGTFAFAADESFRPRRGMRGPRGPGHRGGPPPGRPFGP